MSDIHDRIASGMQREYQRVQEKSIYYASTFYDRLEKQVKDLEAELKEDEQLLIVYYGQGGEKIFVHELSYHNPTLMIFYGIDSQSNDCTVFAHVYAVQLVVTKVKKSTVPEKARKPIGFINEGSNRTEAESSEASSTDEE